MIPADAAGTIGVSDRVAAHFTRREEIRVTPGRDTRAEFRGHDRGAGGTWLFVPRRARPGAASPRHEPVARVQSRNVCSPLPRPRVNRAAWERSSSRESPLPSANRGWMRRWPRRRLPSGHSLRRRALPYARCIAGPASTRRSAGLRPRHCSGGCARARRSRGSTAWWTSATGARSSFSFPTGCTTSIASRAT